MTMDKREARDQAREALRIAAELQVYAAYCLAGDTHQAYTQLTPLSQDIESLRQKHTKEQIDN